MNSKSLSNYSYVTILLLKTCLSSKPKGSSSRKRKNRTKTKMHSITFYLGVRLNKNSIGTYQTDISDFDPVHFNTSALIEKHRSERTKES